MPVRIIGKGSGPKTKVRAFIQAGSNWLIQQLSFRSGTRPEQITVYCRFSNMSGVTVEGVTAFNKDGTLAWATDLLEPDHYGLLYACTRAVQLHDRPRHRRGVLRGLEYWSKYTMCKPYTDKFGEPW